MRAGGLICGRPGRPTALALACWALLATACQSTTPASPAASPELSGQAEAALPATAAASDSAEDSTMTPAPPSATPAPDPAAAGRLSARPHTPASPPAMTPGATPLGLGAERDGQIAAPAGYDPAQPAPLVVLLHGAGGRARGSIGLLQSQADAAGIILLAIDSRAQSWDVIVDRYGPDVRFLDQALSLVFQRYAIDPGRIAIAGFSDGASYALSLGVSNGDLFTHVIAFSPGFLAPKASQGSPALYISHGTRDEVLPIDVCSRAIVPRLEQAGYAVTYHEFDGPHTVPQGIAGEAVAWFLAGR